MRFYDPHPRPLPKRERGTTGFDCITQLPLAPPYKGEGMNKQETASDEE